MVVTSVYVAIWPLGVKAHPKAFLCVQGAVDMARGQSQGMALRFQVWVPNLGP